MTVVQTLTPAERQVLLERVMAKVAVHPDSECWEWTGSKPQGYGRIGWGQRPHQAHRIAYELLVGPIPDGLHIDHLCRNTICVNPDHLEPVTPRVNNLRSHNSKVLAFLAGTCTQGHETALYGVRRKNGPRAGEIAYCRACYIAKRREQRAAA